MVKLLKTKAKEKIVKATREKRCFIYRGTRIRIILDISFGNNGG